MGKASGEQARRARAVREVPRYERLMINRDKSRLIGVLRAAANRLERESRSEAYTLALSKPGRSEVAVTDHAVIRFLERVAGFDIAAIRTEIARAVPLSAFPEPDAGVGGHSVHMKDGFHFLLSTGSVISVLGPEMSSKGWLEREEISALSGAV